MGEGREGWEGMGGGRWCKERGKGGEGGKMDGSFEGKRDISLRRDLELDLSVISYR